jgi:hexaprenyl-diphosphate synthase
MLDYTATEKQLGKPAGGNDLKLGLATAPVLYGSIEYPELRDVIDRKSPTTSDDSYTAAIKKVCSSRGLALTRHLAEWHCQRAEYYIKQLAPSDARDALISISKSVLDRNK